MPYVSVDDFKLGMDTRKPRVSGIPGSLVKLKNGHITRGGHIQRAKKFISTYVLPELSSETAACARFGVTEGTDGNGSVTSITVNGVEILGATVVFDTDQATTATAIAAQITTCTSAPVNYTATSSGNSVGVLTASGFGADVNGYVFAATVTGDLVLGGDPYYLDETKLVLRLEGADAATTTIDESGGCHGSGHTMLIEPNGELDTAEKKYGVSSVIFPGSTTQAVSAPDHADWLFGSGDFCVEGWINIDTAKIAAGNHIFSHWDTISVNERSWMFKWDNGTYTFKYSTDGTAESTITIAQAITALTWHHVAVTRESGTLRIFHDGVKIKEQAVASAFFDANSRMWIGDTAINEGGVNRFDGHIDDVRITKGAARYTAGFTVPDELYIFPPIADVVLAGGVDVTGSTFGLHAQGGNLFTFGGFAEPGGVPSGITYQRLAHKDNPTTTQIASILDTENFDGKIYAIAEFTDGTIYHYYDGARVTAWDNVAATVSSNNTVASSLKTKIDLDPDFVATVITNVVTIEAAVAGVGFTISATAQNFGPVNDQIIALVQTVANGTGGAEVLATGTVTVTGGNASLPYTGSIELVSGGAGSVDTLTVDGVDAMDGTPVSYNTSLTQTAADVATEINGNTTSPNYTATSSGPVVSVMSIPDAEPDSDTFAVAGTSTTITLGNEVALTGGTHNAVDAVYVDGVLITNAHTPYNTSNSQTATDLAAIINGFSSTPNYTAAAVGGVVTITAIAGTGSGPNGFTVARDVVGTLTAGATDMQGGSASGSAAKEKWTATITGTFEAADIFTITLDGQDFVVQGAASATGTTALTFKKKVYSTASSFLYFCAINNPTEWEQPAIGAGYINFSNQDSGSETLNATGIYQGNIGVFSDDVTQIEFVDVDEEANSHLHTARNTGTRSHRSVVQFGNNNLFYLDELSGVRSLQQRDSSGSPQVDDVGTPIDDHLLAFMESLTEARVAAAIGLIGPDGRYWVAMAHRIYIFSFFKSSKISAWSYYEPELGSSDAGSVDYMVRIRKDIYIRSDNVVYQYGGAARVTYPSANELELEIELPFLDLDKAAHYKTLEGIDIGALNTFEINILMNPNDETAESNQFTLSNITYPNAKSGLALRSSHFAPKLVCSSAGAAELYDMAIHYHLDEAS